MTVTSNNQPSDSLISSVARLSRRALVKGVTGALAAAVASPSALRADSPSSSDGQPTTYSVGSFLVDVTKQSIHVRHGEDPARFLWETTSSQPFLQAGVGNATFREHGNPLGSFDVKDHISLQAQFESINSVQMIDASGLVLQGTLSSRQLDVVFRLTFRALSENQLQFAIGVEGPNTDQFNRTFLRYSSSATEAFFGFGQQLTHFNQKGKVTPILVQEHGIGRGLPVVTQLVDLKYDGAGGTPYLTEAPAPHYLTSELRSLFLENKEYSTFDMRAADFVEVKLFSGTMTGRILFGRTPLDLIEEYSAYTGRMRPLPDWVHEGVMVAAQGGMAKVDGLLKTLNVANVPLCGLWIQDWTGTKQTDAGEQVVWNWLLSSQQYPGWDGLVEKLARQNARVLIYVNPFLIHDPCSSGADPSCRDLFREAESNGYLVKQGQNTFTYINSSIRAGMLDLSNPAARVWVKEIIKQEMIDKAHASGWMADFGEALPFDAALSNGADPNVWHNRYPEAWARLHREVIEETGRGEDFLFWNRSGFTQSPGVSTSFWLGDQLQTWDEYDGIKTAVVGLLSGGISGFSLLHSDTGGFVAASENLGTVTVSLARSKELLLRWMELNAFTTMFRTHQGLIPSIRAQVDTDVETLSHLARFGQIYKLLASYRRTLVDEAATKGYPVVRHLFLHYSDDPNVYVLRYQFLLGSDFLIAPVLDKDVKKLHVYLPAGKWAHLWSETHFSIESGKWIEVSAPIGQPGVFFRSGAESGLQIAAKLKDCGMLS